jgi:HK97 gp10 family phage protein
MSVTLQIEGLDKIDMLLDGDRFVQEMDRAVQQSASTLRDETKKLPPVSAKRTGYAALGIPVDTGRLRQSIRSKKTGTLEAEVIADVNYSGLVHEGTDRMPPRPFFQWELEEFGGLQKVDLIINTALRRFIPH